MEKTLINRLEKVLQRYDQHAYDDAGGREQLEQVLQQDPSVIIGDLVDMIEGFMEED